MISFTKKLLLIIVMLFLGGTAYSQGITGKVTDGYFSDPLPGAIVRIPEINVGVETDLDGNYQISGIKAGTYMLEVSYVGYATKQISGVVVERGDITSMDVALNTDDEGITTDEITIEATTSTANEQSVLLEQKNSSKIQDGISEQQIKRAPDSQASDVLKRVSSINIVDDKFVYVRGTSDRYNLTTLNGVMVPSTEPDKKSFSFDLLPSNLLGSMIVSKSYTPDQPGNYSGGLIQVVTKDFPDALTMNYSVSGSYNNFTTGENFKSYDAGERKFLFLNLGLDNGDRELPSNFPDGQIINSIYSKQQINGFSRELRNDWGQINETAPMNAGFQLSIGNRLNVLDNPLGFLFAYSYKNGFDNSEIKNRQYNTNGDSLYSFNGTQSTYKVLQGGILNLNYRVGENNKFGLKTTYTIDSDDKTSFFEGRRDNSSEPFGDNDFRLYETYFVERQLFSTILNGAHYFHGLNRLNVEWDAAYSETFRNEPDLKTMTYQRQGGTEDRFYGRVGRNGIANSEGGGRLFQQLKDFKRALGLDFEMPFFEIVNNQPSKIKFGGMANTLSRSFQARNFAPSFNGNTYFSSGIAYQGIDSIFMLQNIDTTKFQYSELTREEDRYRGFEDYYATYLMFDIPIDKFRIVTGARFEYNEQGINTLGRVSEPVTARLKNNDILPSVNVTYTLNEKTNIRGSFSQTVSRPELREISPYGYYDFINNVIVSGNPELERSLIQNYDLRYELFPQAGEIVSFSLFYKNFEQPIEAVFDPGVNNPARTFVNATDGAINYGAELEVRKSLSFIGKYFKDITLTGNFSLINSKVNLENVQTGETSKERRLQGQAPYTINMGIFYDNYETGTNVNLLYNKSGRSITEVGRNGFGNIEEEGNDILDFSASQRFFKSFEVKFSIKDLLGQDKEYFQEVGGVERLYRSIKSGSDYSLSLSYRI
ncbi:MAG TPA: TonB-dependent receptor [Ignavibacteria bacterium]|nr:TonB-dependent receptor [Ignavibacteria bacterium]